ncbi:isopentenyl-diphosphate delta-isomerase [Methanobrevibacter cuticularis]|uniref:Isopentenyl-diphosphate delta-isomerase n=1 Tax=Methanobrevibacter cuticularis TaxID=47311 RepID=A0A166FJ89_9EURY|nr:type 2 isopentenyl-diphosphate Delta-isomerase [Methanobrevibacter cuticularis]KZX17733.1 isopentenyl-diphosphate delta-isomerase [Methanobrevibacter cuticularis]
MISDRKLEHLLICKQYDVQYKNKKTGFEDIELIHRALPEINKDKIDISTDVFGKKLNSPLIITAITGGHPLAKQINRELAIAAETEKIGLGLGSQRAGIENPELKDTYSVARENAPSTILLGNIGAPQIVGNNSEDFAQQAVDMIDADILAIHLNTLQESIQPEGDIDAKGYLNGINEITENMEVPVMVKETGTGISADDGILLEKAGIDFLDVAGAGGTSWAAVETYRAEDRYLGELFWDWGIPTAVSTAELINSVNIPIVSSGGIRNGLDAAKAIALGSDSVGIALPMLKNAFIGSNEIINFIKRFNESLKIAMFLVGASNLEELKNSNLIIKGETKEWLEERGFNTKKYTRRI